MRNKLRPKIMYIGKNFEIIYKELKYIKKMFFIDKILKKLIQISVYKKTKNYQIL